jgi:hypothetical protein
MAIRMPPAESAYLAAVVDRLRVILDEALIAVYPTGSLALDGYVPGRSDIDVLAVAARVPARPVLETIAARLSHRELPCPATGLEFVLYPSDAVTGGVEAGYALDLNTGRKLPPKIGLDPTGAPRFWYVIDRAICYQSDRTLFGPPPHAVLSPVPFDTLLPVVIESVRAHADAIVEHGDNAVLNACRALRFGAQRRWYSKQAAASWALDAAIEHTDLIEYRDLIETAMAAHRAARADRPAVPATAAGAFLGYVVRRLGGGR